MKGTGDGSDKRFAIDDPEGISSGTLPELSSSTFPSLGRVGGPDASDAPLAGVADVYRFPLLAMEMEGGDLRGGVALALFGAGWLTALSFNGCGGSLPVLLGVTAQFPVSLVYFLLFESGFSSLTGAIVHMQTDGERACVQTALLRLDRTLHFVGSLFCAMVVCPYVWFVLLAAFWHLFMLRDVWLAVPVGRDALGGEADRHWSVFGATVGVFVSVPLLVQQLWVYGLVTALCLLSAGMFYHPEFRESLGGAIRWRCAVERVLLAVWVYCVCASVIEIGT